MSEEENFKLKSTCRELAREKSRLMLENQTLQDELRETRLKLEEAARYESPQSHRRMDTGLSFQGSCQDHSHVTLSSRLQVAEARRVCLESEVEVLNQRKEMIIGETDQMKRKYARKVERLAKDKQHLEQLLSVQTNDFDIKYNEIKVIVETQQEYITELETSLMNKEEENNDWIGQIHGQIKYFMTDALETITAVEEKRSATVQRKNQIVQELTKLQGQFDHLKDEIKTRQEYCISMCQKALSLLNINADRDYLTQPEWSKYMEQDTSLEAANGSQDKKEDFDPNKNALIELKLMKTVLCNISTVKEMFSEQQTQLRNRIRELDNTLKTDKHKHTHELELLEKKCSEYKQLVKKLKVRVPKRDSHARATLPKEHEYKYREKEVLRNSGPEEKTKDKILQEKHACFEKFLRDLDPYDS